MTTVKTIKIKIQSKTYPYAVTMFLLLFICMAQAAETTILFDQTKCPDCVSGNITNGNEWETLGLTISNTYWYSDVRDTFDTMGLSITVDAPATISFASSPSNLTFDYWVIAGHQATYEAFDTAHNSLGSVLSMALLAMCWVPNPFPARSHHWNRQGIAVTRRSPRS